MAASKAPVRTPVSPNQGELLSGVRPDPHFEAPPESEVAYGVYVGLQERNEALQSALIWLGKMARSASFRDIGNRQAEGSRSPAVRKIERSYLQSELQEKLDNSERADEGMAKAMKGKFRKAYGVKQLVDGRTALELPNRKGELVHLSSKNIMDSAKSGAGILDGDGKRVAPGPKEGLDEFEARFGGSNNRSPRDRLKRQLGRQATTIKRTKRNTTQRV